MGLVFNFAKKKKKHWGVGSGVGVWVRCLGGWVVFNCTDLRMFLFLKKILLKKRHHPNRRKISTTQRGAEEKHPTKKER